MYSYAKKLDELGQAAAACDEAQKRLDAGDDLTRMDLYLVRSYALVEHANYVHDETFQQREKDLLEAIDGAEKAAELQADRPLLAPGGSDRPGDYPDLAMGNAYEDLAWIVNKDPPGNYRQPLRRSSGRARRQLSPMLPRLASAAAITGSPHRVFWNRRSSPGKR